MPVLARSVTKVVDPAPVSILGVTRKLFILNMGAGVESCAIWAEWYYNPDSRPFESWADLIVIMAQTGDEHRSTKRLMEEYILPQMRELGVRFIQVAKPKPECSSRGYVILEDTRDSTTLHIRDERIARLSTSLADAGTLQARSSAHFCAERYKGIPIDAFVVDALYYEIVNPPKVEDLGYVVLDDSRCPTTLYIRDGRIQSLSEDLGQAGSLQSRAATHFCAVERKGKILDRLIVDLIYHEVISPPATSLAADLERLKALGLTHLKGGVPLDDIEEVHRLMCDGRGKFPEPGSQKYRRSLISLIDAQLSIGPIIGYNADETARVTKSKEYTFRGFAYLYLLVEWGWSRAYCLYKLWHHYGVLWLKSACFHCPYCHGNEAALRWLKEPEAGEYTLWMEFKALLLNPNMELYNSGSAIEWAQKIGSAEAIARFHARLAAASWQLWWVRRTVITKVDKGGKTTSSIKRSTEAYGYWKRREDAIAALRQIAEPDADGRAVIIPRGTLSGGDGKGMRVELEGLLVVAPDDMIAKVQYEKSFEAHWALGQGPKAEELLAPLNLVVEENG